MITIVDQIISIAPKAQPSKRNAFGVLSLHNQVSDLANFYLYTLSNLNIIFARRRQRKKSLIFVHLAHISVNHTIFRTFVIDNRKHLDYNKSYIGERY